MLMCLYIPFGFFLFTATSLVNVFKEVKEKCVLFSTPPPLPFNENHVFKVNIFFIYLIVSISEFYLGLQLFIMNYVDHNYPRVKRKYNILFKLWKSLPTREEWTNANLEGDNVSTVYITRIVGPIAHL